MIIKNLAKKISDRLTKLEITRKNLQASFFCFYYRVFKLEIARWFLLKRQRKLLGIVSANLETISNCNRQCEFCFNHPRFRQRPAGKMDFSTWKKIIDDFAELKFAGRLGPHFYNEPLLDNRLDEWIRYARFRLPWTWFQINSNGDFLTEERFLSLIKAGVNSFFITNYDDDEKPHLNLLQKKYPALITVVKNCDMHRTDRGGEIFHKNQVLNKPCLRPQAQIVINWEAKMLLCCMDYYANNVLGNLQEESIKEILVSSRYTSLIKSLASNRQNGLPICHNCDDAGKIPW